MPATDRTPAPSEMVEAMLSVFASVLDERGAVYCSAPITTGRRYLAWLRGIGKTLSEVDDADESLRFEHQGAVVAPNSIHAQGVIAVLRRQNDLPVIDPTSLPYRLGWTQPHWRHFWSEVIRRYAVRAVFVDHWEYSNGCAFEFLACRRKGILTETEAGQSMTLALGLELIERAITDIGQHGGSTAFLEGIWGDLNQLAEE